MTKTHLTTLLSFFAPLRAYIVGGAVRDYLRGISPKDIDVVVVGATPEHLLQLGGIPVDPKTGIPVFKFKINSLSVEVALPRREVKSQAGYKGFKFVTSPDIPLEEDLQRRDFTINAIAMDAYGNIVDPSEELKTSMRVFSGWLILNPLLKTHSGSLELQDLQLKDLGLHRKP